MRFRAWSSLEFLLSVLIVSYRYLKFVKLKPGKVLTGIYGEIDLSFENVGMEFIKELYESDNTFLEIKEEGKAKLYGLKAKV